MCDNGLDDDIKLNVQSFQHIIEIKFKGGGHIRYSETPPTNLVEIETPS